LQTPVLTTAGPDTPLRGYSTSMQAHLAPIEQPAQRPAPSPLLIEQPAQRAYRDPPLPVDTPSRQDSRATTARAMRRPERFAPIVDAVGP